MEADVLDDVGMEAVGDGAGAGCGLDESLGLVIVPLSFGECDVHDDAGYAARVGGHLLLYLDCRSVNVESVGLGRDAHDGQHAGSQRGSEYVGGGEILAFPVVVQGCVGDNLVA